MTTWVASSDQLKSVEIESLNVYLETRGWDSEAAVGGTVWRYSVGDDEAFILVPRSNSFRDYARRVREAIETLAEVEGRHPGEVLENINLLGYDVQYVITRPPTRSGTTPLLDGVNAFHSIQDWVLSAAVTEALPARTLIQPSRKPVLATNLLRSVRLGTTSPGSYVISVHIPVFPVGSQGALDLTYERLESFERSVSRRLFTATNTARKCAVNVSETGEYETFFNSSQLGVTANLCEALVGFSGRSDSDFAVSFSWAGFGAPVESTQVDFSSEQARILKEAARLMRENEPEPDVTLIGNVVRLHSEGEHRSGELSILGRIEGDPSERSHRIWLNLSPDEYRTAGEAHMEGLTVQAKGDLVRRGTRLRLNNIRNFAVIPDLDDLPGLPRF